MANKPSNNSNSGCATVIGFIFIVWLLIRFRKVAFIILGVIAAIAIVFAIISLLTGGNESTGSVKSPIDKSKPVDFQHSPSPTTTQPSSPTKRPLTAQEIQLLSAGRRAEYINNNFRIVPTSFKINPRYRESLEKEGRWDRISVSYQDIFPAITELLRFKRHEWSVWVLANETEGAKFIWSNKGDDNESCYFTGSQAVLIALAQENDCNTVIHFHNHPHTKERYWDLLSPSKQDLETLEKLSEIYDSVGLNLIDGLCSQGQYIIYGQMFSTKYIPCGCSVQEIEAANGITDKGDKALRKELRRKKNIKIEKLK